MKRLFIYSFFFCKRSLRFSKYLFPDLSKLRPASKPLLTFSWCDWSLKPSIGKFGYLLQILFVMSTTNTQFKWIFVFPHKPSYPSNALHWVQKRSGQCSIAYLFNKVSFSDEVCHTLNFMPFSYSYETSLTYGYLISPMKMRSIWQGKT